MSTRIEPPSTEEAKMPEAPLKIVTESGDEALLKIVTEGGEPVMYLELNGKRIAKRYPGQSWITLEPGYRVAGGEPGTYELGSPGTISIKYNDSDARPQ
jgi:hypothetical protein